jgi:hypothetical protein
MLYKKFLLPFLFLLVITGCDNLSQDEYVEYVFVESYVVAHRSLPEIKISTTAPVNEEYRFSESALTGANIQIVLLSENGDDEEVFGYNASQRPGIYLPQSESHRALPKRSYRLDIDFNDRQEVLSATTTIPDAFEILNEVPDTLTYQSDNQLEITISPTENTQKQNVFVFSAVALNPSMETLTPFYRAAVDNDDAEINNFLVNSSGLINEGNFDINPDGTITLKFPWIGVAFYEGNYVVANSIDKNLYDLVRSQQVQLGGGSTLSPGEIPNAIYNIEGGIGVFGSLSSDTVQTYFKSPFQQ